MLMGLSPGSEEKEIPDAVPGHGLHILSPGTRPWDRILPAAEGAPSSPPGFWAYCL
jgi:hypothetical protein